MDVQFYTIHNFLALHTVDCELSVSTLSYFLQNIVVLLLSIFYQLAIVHIIYGHTYITTLHVTMDLHT